MIVQRLRDFCARVADAARTLLPRRARSPRADPKALFDGHQLRASTTLGEPIAWPAQEFEEIGIQTTTAGPFIEDVFWVVRAQGKSVCIPHESDAAKALLEYASRLERFDWEPFIQAMSSTENRYFRCWKHQ